MEAEVNVKFAPRIQRERLTWKPSIKTVSEEKSFLEDDENKEDIIFKMPFCIQCFMTDDTVGFCDEGYFICEDCYIIDGGDPYFLIKPEKIDNIGGDSSDSSDSSDSDTDVEEFFDEFS